MASTLLDVRQVDVGYGQVPVLHDLSIHLTQGECVGLFGPNGHGKTTLLRTISGLLKPWRGEIWLGEKRIDGRPPSEIVDLGVIHVAQGSTLFPRMSVVENLKVGAYSRRTWSDRNQNMEKVFALFPRLAERRNQLCQTLSGGERQMVAIGIGLMGDAKLLMLDEPSLGLAPLLKEELENAIEKIAATVSILLVEQDVEFLLNLADRLYLVEEGRVVLEQDSEHPNQLEHEQIMQMYFGGSDRSALANIMERDQ